MPDETVTAEAVNLCKKTPLYTPCEMTVVNGSNSAGYLKYFEFQFDEYCIHCEKDSTFRAHRSYGHEGALDAAIEKKVFGPGAFGVVLKCQRQTSHEYFYVFQSIGKRIQKIGQSPSMETIANSDISRFRGILEEQYYRELHRAGGLMSHGIGIGSFVYLRRIFERLVQTHTDQVIPELEREEFSKKRIDERIEALRSVLPEVLVENKSLYGILSSGIHEMSEEECKRYFPIVRAGIIAILEEDLQKAEKAKAAKRLRDEIADITGEIKNGSSADSQEPVKRRDGKGETNLHGE